MKNAYVTMKDIANKLNCSVTTVSKAFKNHPDLNRETRDLILKTADEMGYVKNYSASILRKKKTNIIGVLIASAPNPFYSAIFFGIESTARKHGYQIIFANSQRDIKIQEDSIRMFQERRVDGIIIAPVEASRNRGDQFSFSNIQGIVGFSRDGGEYDMVYSDEYQGGYDATAHLIKQGCRRIVMLNSYCPQRLSMNRTKGYLNALSEAGIEKDDKLLVSCEHYDPDHRMNEGYFAIKRCIEEGIRFDGIFGYNDILIYGAIKALKEKGLSVPGDVALVGYDDLDYSGIMTPTLSSVYYSKDEMGSVITELLLKRIKDPSLKGSEIKLDTKLMVRGSSLKI